MVGIKTKNHGDQRHPRDTANTVATILHFFVPALLREGKKVIKGWNLKKIEEEFV
jgi:hypothetical protein